MEFLIVRENSLRYLTPDYFITSKLATKYNKYAISNYLAIRDTYFDVDKWFQSIANGDEELVKLTLGDSK